MKAKRKYQSGGKFAEQAAKAQSMRPFARKNSDGTESTVLMEFSEADGKYYAYPTIFPKSGNTGSTDPKDWDKPNDPWSEALKRGEMFEFDTEDEASNFAKGSWKEFIKVPKKTIKPVYKK